MDTVKYRAWMYARQGLENRKSETARQALARAGWQRSIGGVNPYLAIRARSGEGRSQVDALAADLQIFELPSARGCTYVLPAEHFAVGLAIGRGFGMASDFAIARKLGVEDAEVEALKTAVTAALSRGPLAPSELKTALGEKVRNLGEEGKRRGLTTTLPLALGLLQTEGRIRRKPVNGRLDTQRYDYELWDPALTGMPGVDEAAAEIAQLFFGWAGAATLKDFRDFTAFTVRTAQAARDRAGIVSFGEDTDLLCLPGARENFAAYRAPSQPAYSLVGNLDSYLALRRTGSFWLHEEDQARLAPTDKGLRPVSQLAELWSHAILDRGRLIGLWEYDAEAERIVCSAWIPADEALRAEIDAVETYIREDLGDARSFSLDSPASRRPRLDALRDLPAA
jgi:hypothetical protein